MPTYRLTVQYDGTDFAGWQSQPGRRTAMGVLRDGVERVTGEQPAMTAAGRTDAGAHAHGQVVGVSLGREWEPARLRAAVDSVLPEDLALIDVQPADTSFDARRDAVDRTYRYLVVHRDGRSPVTRRHAWTVRGPLDVAAMADAATFVVGTHDFGAFGASPRSEGTTVRTVHEAMVTPYVVGDGDAGSARIEGVVVSVRANAFLRGMMRAFTGALVRVGQGRADGAWVRDLVDAGAARNPQLTVAPAAGLHQWRVRYQIDVARSRAA